MTGEPRRRMPWSPDRVLLATGAVMLPVGLAAILLGWYGAARTPFVFEQIPYLISGGLLGVGLMVAGGLLYLASWLTRLVDEQRRAAAQLRELLLDLGVSAAPATATDPPDGPPLVATATGTLAHRPDCAVVAGKNGLRPVPATGDGLRPCKLCNPRNG